MVAEGDARRREGIHACNDCYEPLHDQGIEHQITKKGSLSAIVLLRQRALTAVTAANKASENQAVPLDELDACSARERPRTRECAGLQPPYLYL